MEKESEFLNKLMIFFMYRGENYIIKTKFIYRGIYGDYTILDYLFGQEASYIYRTMRNIFYLD